MLLIARIALFFSFVSLAGPAYSQVGAVDSAAILQRKLNVAKADTNKVKLLLALGKRYTLGSLKDRTRLDSALLLYDQAYNLSVQMKNDLLAYRSLSQIAIYKLSNNSFQQGNAIIHRLIDRCRKSGKSTEEAELLILLSDHLWNIDSKRYGEECRRNVIRATEIFTDKNDQLELTCLRGWKIKYLIEKGDSNAAEKEALLMRSELITLKYTGTYYSWVLHKLSGFAFNKSDLYKQLFYELENLNMLIKHPENATVHELESSYYKLAQIYYNLGNYEKSEFYARQQLPFTHELNGNYTFGLHYLVINLLKQKKPLDALKILTQTTKKFPTVDSDSKMAITTLFGYTYLALNEFTPAEKFLNQSLEIYEATDPMHKRIDYYSSIYRAMIDLYIKKGDYVKAKPYISGLEPIMKQLPPSYNSRFAEFKSKLDSSEGKFYSALRNYQTYKRLSDSLLDADKRAKLSYLEVAFGTREKQSQIELLNAKNKAQLSEVQKANLVRNITIAGICLLVFLLTALFYSLRAKVKTNRLLRLKTTQIDAKNDSLIKLVAEKEGLIIEKENLLGEKDMLLKEVHHRVKNNLQIVMSLLSTKLVYLENKEAVEAIEESQHRVQSIAMIHQKLYREGNGLSIQLKSYLHDLVENLDVSLNAAMRAIKFEVSVENIVLDVEQAVPIGLILNEAITNAIKYAFDARGGKISISIRNLDEESIELVVKDNGKGLGAEFDLSQSNSLGMEMMKGLGHQLKGILNISNHMGVTIKLKFPVLQSSNHLRFV